MPWSLDLFLHPLISEIYLLKVYLLRTDEVEHNNTHGYLYMKV